uniref:WAT1-related protein n=1 Tax=Cucumis melo TaxID=3656 RepID=A0A9I9EFL4_CUCME
MELKKPLIGAIVVQITYSGMSILAKAAFTSGKLLELSSLSLLPSFSKVSGAAAFNALPVTTFLFALLLRITPNLGNNCESSAPSSSPT